MIDDPLDWNPTCPECGGYGFDVDDDEEWVDGPELYFEEPSEPFPMSIDDDTEPNPLAWLEELDPDDPLRTGESEWERGLRTGESS